MTKICIVNSLQWLWVDLVHLIHRQYSLSAV
jgi:hypothetical protein